MAHVVCTRRYEAAGILIGSCSVPVYFIVSNGITVLPAAITRIALYGVDIAVLHFLHDANAVGQTVLRPGEVARFAFIKVNNITQAWLVTVALL